MACMVDRIDIQKYIKDEISGHTSCRTDCPNCGGHSCLSISKIDGYIVYQCFRASCKLRGKLHDDLSVDTIRTYLDNLPSNSISSPPRGPVSKQVYKIPDHFISPLQNTFSHSLLSRYNLIDYYVHNPTRIRYDPKLNRLVFILVDHEGVPKGATGRSLVYSNTLPRWYVYDRLGGCPYIARRSGISTRTAILVEDCISACVGNRILDCIALLGTSISSDCIQFLLPYDNLYVALDDDATGKAIKLQKQLSAYKPTQIIPLRKDLKYYSPDELQDLKNEIS